MAAIPARGGAGIAANRPAGAMLRVLGMAGGGGRRGIGPPLRVAVAGTSPAFFDPRPVFLPGGGAAARVTPVKGTAPERMNMRRPDGPSTESIAYVQQMIERLTAYGLGAGEAVAEQLQELRNTLQAMLELAGTRAILGPYYRPEQRNREPGR